VYLQWQVVHCRNAQVLPRGLVPVHHLRNYAWVGVHAQYKADGCSALQEEGEEGEGEGVVLAKEEVSGEGQDGNFSEEFSEDDGHYR